MKRILKYFLLTILTLFILSGTVFLGIFARYQLTTRAQPGRLQVDVVPGEIGQWVNPFIGTGGFPAYTGGDDMPGPSMPFGSVRLSPDTHFFLGDHFFDESTVSTAGYYYGDTRMMGFSHTRLIGTGALDGGHFRVIPTLGEEGLVKYREGKYHKFSHKDEVAFPGYYAVQFRRQGILAELTAGERTGIHRYWLDK
ncbi:MAG: hypothetical protein ACP5D9_18245 [Mariniphaga sp.]